MKIENHRYHFNVILNCVFQNMVAFSHITNHKLIFSTFLIHKTQKNSLVNLLPSLLSECEINFSYLAIVSSTEHFDCQFSFLWVSGLFINSSFRRRGMFQSFFRKKEWFINLENCFSNSFPPRFFVLYYIQNTSQDNEVVFIHEQCVCLYLLFHVLYRILNLYNVGGIFAYLSDPSSVFR